MSSQHHRRRRLVLCVEQQTDPEEQQQDDPFQYYQDEDQHPSNHDEVEQESELESHQAAAASAASAASAAQMVRPPKRICLESTASTNTNTNTNTNDSTVIATSPQLVLQKIEDLIFQPLIQDYLHHSKCPIVAKKHFFHATQCRSLTSLLLVAAFCHELLVQTKTTTTREVYYHFVTHFRNQQECDTAIWELASLLQVPRSSLGLHASPKGWCCGCFDVHHSNGVTINGRALQVHGLPITASLIESERITSHDAKFILVIEKEGIYTRLSQDGFDNCIMVTGKGFPDLATRQFVQLLQRTLRLPVYGLCDCNPYGISLLQSYHYSAHMSAGYYDNTNDDNLLNMEWIGLLPSSLEELDLPSHVYQTMTKLDHKRLDTMLSRRSSFLTPTLRTEMLKMKELNAKVELEALHWKGMDFLGEWVKKQILKRMELA